MKSLENIKLPKEIITFLDTYKTKLIYCIGNKLNSIYLHGSIAMNAFKKETSDIDILITLNGDLSDEDYIKLDKLHKELKKSSDWGNKIECSYINESLLKSKEIPNKPRAYFNNQLAWEKYGTEWVIERHIISQYGIKIYGNDIEKESMQISKDEIKEAIQALLVDWWLPKIDDLENLSDDYIVYGVLTMCRMIYTLDIGEIGTKSESVRYVLEKETEDLKPMIKEAINWTNESDYISRRDAIEFIRKTIMNLITGKEVI